MHGVNPKAWFYGLKKHLDRRPRVSRAAIATAAGEQWLNGELAGWLGDHLPEDLTVFSEIEKRDLSICRLVEGKPPWEHPVAALEIKLVYRNYSNDKVEEYAERLISQMLANNSLGIPSYGWFGSVFNSWEGRTLETRTTFGEERRRSGEILRRVAGTRVRVARKSMETILEDKTVHLGGQAWRVGLAAQYLSLT